MDLLKLPTEVQIHILTFVDEREFDILKHTKECSKLFTYPNEERVYMERSIYNYFECIEFKNNSTWKDFYERVNYLKKCDKIEYAKQCASEERLMELQIIAKENKNIFNWVLPIDIVCVKGNLDIIKWFISIGRFPNAFSVGLLADEGHLHCLEYLYENYNLLPNTSSANWAAESGHIHILEWLEERGVLPNNIGALSAAVASQLPVLNWLAERNILPAQFKATNAVIATWLNEHGIFPEDDEEDDSSNEEDDDEINEINNEVVDDF